MADILDFPFENPITKAAIGIGVLWVGFIALNYTKRNEQTPHRRKHRQALTSNHIDRQIDSRNRAVGHRVPPTNPDIPTYSRHNYNRRRRGNNWR